jgi:hypothetical protein
MAIFTAAAAYVVTAIAGITFSSVAAFAVRTLVTIGVSKLISNRANKKAAGANDVGSRVQLGPATNNKLAPSYGSAFLAPTVTDAKITTDQKTMYYVFSICEATSGIMSFGKIFWNGKEVTLGAGDYSGVNKVVSLTNNATPPQVDTSIDGSAWIYQFPNGSSSGVNTGGTSAITILQDSGIPAADRWTSTDTMTDTCFVIVKVNYNKDVQDAHNMPRLSLQLTNTLTKPGEVLLDYMTDVQYGCAIDVANIDTASLTALDVYSDQTITYVPVGGGSTTQPRYRVNGPVNTGDDCLSNLQQLVDTCDSWLQYSELTGKWKVVINKPYTGTLADLYHVDSSVLIGGIDINPIDLNQTYNSLEVQYPDANISDQTNYKVVDMTDPSTAWYDPTLLSPNEPDNKIVVQFPQVNNYIQAVYLGVRRLLQSREDLVINCQLDYSGIQIEAGDVVRVTLAEYGWADKLFRVSQVQETKTGDGFLGARITAFEYNATIYNDNAIQDFVPAANTGLTDPNIFDTPTIPVVLNGPLANGAINYFTVSSNVPAIGSTLYMDFNVGNSSNLQTHTSYSSVQVGDGTPYTANSTITINVADLDPGTYYWSATARNDFAGKQSSSSNAFVWGGPSVTNYKLNTFVCANSTGNVVTTVESTANVRAGMSVIVTGGTGAVVANTLVTNVLSANTFTINPAPTTPFSCATLKVGGGGITFNQMAPDATGLAVVTAYDVSNFAGNINIPIAASSTSTRNIPLIYPGSNVASGYVFPYAQGSATTANGYSSNSTAAWTPNTAALLNISASANSYQNWYKLIDVDVSNGTWTTDEFIISMATFNIYSDTPNTIVQIAPYARFSDTLSTNFVQTQYLSTFTIPNVFPSTNVISVTYNNRAVDTVSSLGIYIRNITGGSNVTVYTGTYAVQQRYIGPGSVL